MEGRRNQGRAEISAAEAAQEDARIPGAGQGATPSTLAVGRPRVSGCPISERTPSCPSRASSGGSEPDDVPGGGRQRGAQPVTLDHDVVERRRPDPLRVVLGVGGIEVAVVQCVRLRHRKA